MIKVKVKFKYSNKNSSVHAVAKKYDDNKLISIETSLSFEFKHGDIKSRVKTQVKSLESIDCPQLLINELKEDANYFSINYNEEN